MDEASGGRFDGTGQDGGTDEDGHVRPTAVGLVRHAEPDSEPRRRHACLTLAARAHREGYALVQTFELDGSALRDRIALAGLVDLTARSEVSVVLAAGALDEPLLQDLRERANVRVVALPES